MFSHSFPEYDESHEDVQIHHAIELTMVQQIKVLDGDDDDDDDGDDDNDDNCNNDGEWCLGTPRSQRTYDDIGAEGAGGRGVDLDD
ncbi:hypothetical protein PV325_007103 [Microctonus aethiopoides]|nr:hypothetical protein PV325_007103 [Microctonus aethiopoides]